MQDNKVIRADLTFFFSSRHNVLDSGRFSELLKSFLSFSWPTYQLPMKQALWGFCYHLASPSKPYVFPTQAPRTKEKAWEEEEE